MTVAAFVEAVRAAESQDRALARVGELIAEHAHDDGFGLAFLRAEVGRVSEDPWTTMLAGILARTAADHEGALIRYRAAAQRATELSEIHLAGRAQVWSGDVLRHLGRTKPAVGAVQEGLQQLADAPGVERAWALHVLGRCHAESGKLDAAADAYAQSEYLFGLASDNAGRLAATSAIADLQAELGHLDDAQRSYLKASELQQHSGDVRYLCLIQAGLSRVRAMRADLGDTPDTLAQVIAAARENALPDAEAAALAALATAHWLAGETAPAEDATARAIELIRARGDHRALLRLHATAAEQRALRSEVGAAREALRAAKAIADIAGDPFSSAIVALAAGAVSQAAEDVPAALAAYWRAAETARSCGASYLEAKATILAAHLEPEPARAADELRRALLAVVREGYRDIFVGRAELGAWVRGRAAQIALSATDRERLDAALAATRPAGSSDGVVATGLQVVLLGQFEVRLGGVRISDRAWRTSKAKELFALLLINRRRVLARDEIIEALWPEADVSSGVSNFHFTLHSLRKALTSVPSASSVASVRTDGGYQLEAIGPVPVDLELFELLNVEARQFQRAGRPDDTIRLLRAAGAIYRGDFLADLSGAWVDERREELSRQYLAGLRQLAELELERENVDSAMGACRQYLRREPYDEHIHRLLLRAYHASGDPRSVLRHYEALVKLLKDDLSERPEKATEDLVAKLKVPRTSARVAPLRILH